MTDRSAEGSRRVALTSLLLVCLAFNFPVFLGRVAFPVDIAQARPPNSLYRPAPMLANPLESDAVDLYYPWRTYLGERLAEGDLPLWDPHRLAGTPFAANPQTAVFYPSNWLFAVTPFLAATTLIAVLSNLGALLLAYWFFRVLELHRYAAVAGAVVFAYSGFLMAWARHPTFLASAMWLPLALGGIEAAFRGRPRRGIPLAGLGLALSVLGGQTQVAIYVWLAAGLWTAVAVAARALSAPGEGRPRVLRELGRGAIVGLSSLALGLALSSLQLLASIELSDRIIRGPEPYDALVSAALEPAQAATMFLPDRFGNPVDGNYVGDHNYTETAAYVGVAALIVAGLAIWQRRDRITLGFGVIGVVGVLGALGTPLYRILYEVVPGLSQTRAIGRMVLLVDVALAGLAAIGLDALLRGRRRSTAATFVAAGAVAIAVPLAAVLPQASLPAGYLAPRIAAAVTIVVAVGAVVLLMVHRPTWTVALALPLVGLLALDLWLFGFRYHPFQRPATLSPVVREVDYLRSLPGPRVRIARLKGPVLPLNASLVYGLSDVHGFDTFILARTVELLSLAQDQVPSADLRNQIGPFSAEALTAPTIDLLGVSQLVAPLVPSTSNSGFANRFAVLDQPGAFTPAFLASCWKLLPRTAVLDRLRTMTEREIASTAVVEEGPESRAALGRARSGECPPGETVSVDQYEPERVQLTTDAEVRSVLVLTDAWYPGWEAVVDGRKAPVLSVDHALRGVVLEPGTHRIELVYRPAWIGIGLIVTLIGAAAAVAYGWRVDRLLRSGRRSRHARSMG